MNIKNIFLSSIVLLVSFVAKAQEPSGGNFRFGLKGAMNIGWIKPVSNNLLKEPARVSFGYGLMGDYYFRENYAISGELMISSMRGGVTLKDSQIFTDKSYGGANPVSKSLRVNYNLQYLELPVTLKFRTKEVGYMRYWGQFGLGTGFLVSARASLDGDVPESVRKSGEYKDFRVNESEGEPFTTNNFDDRVFLVRMGLIIGGGIEYGLAGNTALYTGLRFNNGFSNIFVKDKNSNAKNNALSLSVGVLF